ncbi:hypothetical protein FHU41_000229 [Psychromicrobium silvestre]|uniref:Uncharacterized protein n=1 Tax=Psychromicrobium silvestre TaxID=1645614 RepID=A0A7Y9S3R6_9MICC|nr:hypothetical protein [Psychromicrobium silvestre]NYE94008.1 hypothetical protein [Psychromicrobium silvestre]
MVEKEYLIATTPAAKGLDLPTRFLWTEPIFTPLSVGLSDLKQEVFGQQQIPHRCVGFVRNVVPQADASYRYPTPWAHVPVYLMTEPLEPIVAGHWLSVEKAREELSERHWWRIVEHHLSTPS